MPQIFRAQYPYAYNHELGPIFIILRPADRRKTFTCGEKIKGRVRVKTFTRASNVTISFIGRTACSKDEDSTMLFSFTNILFSDPEGIAYQAGGSFPLSTNVPMAFSPTSPTHVDFPFEFSFPERVEAYPEEINNGAYGESESFESRPGFLLPPTLWAQNGSAKVEYYLEAHLPETQKFFSGKMKVRHHIQFSPSAVVDPYLEVLAPLKPSSDVLVRQLTHSLESSENRGRLARLKNTMRSEQETLATFSVNISVPGEIRVGETIPFKIWLRHLNQREDALGPPVVSLRCVVVKAQMHILARVPLADSEHGSSTAENINIATAQFKKPILMFDGMTLGGMLPSIALDKKYLPDFKSYGVSVTHDLKVRLVIECGGKMLGVDFKRENVVFLPMRREGEAEEVLDLPLYEEDDGHRDGTGEAPAYMEEEMPPAYTA
ncbi:hypothetical protein K504DRAFT_445407 [Pleomassaria siparia CBS 279.74]|uniref:Arrestin-like N-terminal domain-containing protein n=1 Tax=Pleomassaria siparia CBS 279.74 TaxID=1314801 RepID=A0A6G1KNL5_9PLEO|nr:hypothetical protein K504DRAFT_445407 [Pleomassaria siparia CBS 279.74]